MSVALAHGGLPEGVKPYQLIGLVKDVSRSEEKTNRISRTAVAVLEYIISGCRDGDFRTGMICGTWEQPATIAVKLGISTKVLHNAEAELREKGYIERTSTAHARRCGKRCGDKIVRLEGISLRPLIDAYGRLVAIREAIQLQREAVVGLRHEIAHLRRHIREAGNPYVADEAEAILPRGRTSRIEKAEKLAAIKVALDALLVSINLPSGDTKSSDRTEEICAPTILTQDSSKNRNGAAEPKPDAITPALAASLASDDYQALVAARGGPNWSNLIEASATASNWLGISQRVWGEACHVMGRERAALCVLAIDRNRRLPEAHRYRVRSPQPCLIGMTKRASAGSFNLLGLVRAAEPLSEGQTGLRLEREPAGQASFAFALGKVLSRIQTQSLGGRP